MELHLLSASLARRDSCYLILSFIDVKSYTREFTIIMGKVKEYYERDESANFVNRELFLELLATATANAKHLERFTSIIDQAYQLETSTVNIDELIIKSKLNEVGDKLAVALANREDAINLIEEYTSLHKITALEELMEKGTEILTSDDIDSILSDELSGVGAFRLYPLALDERLGSRCKGGHHIVTFARPEMGKSALNITIACGFARQGAPGIYFINEDRVEDIYMRILSNLTGMTTDQIRANPPEAKEKANRAGLNNIRLISLSPGNPKQVEAFVEKYEPMWIVMDQLRNLNVKEANKVLQLEYATSAMRNIGKKYDCITVSTTQAGDSAEGKRLLTMGDVDFSNTGVAAQADVLVGLGGDPGDVERGIRYVNISKNKITGIHQAFPIKLNPYLSRYTSVTEQQASLETV